MYLNIAHRELTHQWHIGFPTFTAQDLVKRLILLPAKCFQLSVVGEIRTPKCTIPTFRLTICDISQCCFQSHFPKEMHPFGLAMLLQHCFRNDSHISSSFLSVHFNPSGVSPVRPEKELHSKQMPLNGPSILPGFDYLSYTSALMLFSSSNSSPSLNHFLPLSLCKGIFHCK